MLTPRKLGYAMMLEKDAIRKQLLADGIVDDVELYFLIEQRYIDAHANDKTYRERSQQIASRAAHLQLEFTKEELVKLVEHFEYANDPISISIFDKAKELLRRKSDST